MLVNSGFGVVLVLILDPFTKYPYTTGSKFWISFFRIGPKTQYIQVPIVNFFEFWI
jgi:hypothetical protein